MEEYQLIEIARRFRVMEDAIDIADLQLAGIEQDAQDQVSEAECPSELELAEGQLKEIVDLRASLESAVEQCREDMTAMQEAIREVNGVTMCIQVTYQDGSVVWEPVKR